MPETPSPTRRFDIALSFPGEHRDFVAAVADRLAAAFGRERVLYDKYYEAEFARLDLAVYLPSLYRKEAELIVLFLCPQYAAKRWCKLEWRQIGQLIANLDQKRIMLLRHGHSGDFEELGILEGDGTIDFQARSADEIAKLICERFVLNGGTLPVRTEEGAPTASKITSPPDYDVSRILRYAPAELIGRKAEVQALDEAWAKAQAGEPKRPRVVSFVALGGEGKTSLVAKWAVELGAKGWPGCEAAFAWSFYSQGTREQLAASSDLFFAEALKFFGVATEEKASGYEKGRRLARALGERRALLILDGLEPLQYALMAPTPGELKDDGLAALLRGLAQNGQGLCLVTTRYSIPDLKAFWSTTAPETALTRLSREAGAAPLLALGVTGLPAEFEELVEAVKGHALTLTLIGTYLRDAHGGDIRKRDLFKLEEANAEEQHGHAFHVMDAYVRQLASEGERGERALALLRLLGLFDRPADVAKRGRMRDRAAPIPLVVTLPSPPGSSPARYLRRRSPRHLAAARRGIRICADRRRAGRHAPAARARHGAVRPARR